jgi:hypothetical protein
MEALKEVTVWSTSFQPNHTYLLEGSKVLAYLRDHKGPPIWGTPMRFDRRGRKFVKADISLFNVEEQPKSKLIEFTGSTGSTYYVDPEAKTCTCPGYQFRGKCKHVEKVLDISSV